MHKKKTSGFKKSTFFIYVHKKSNIIRILMGGCFIKDIGTSVMIPAVITIFGCCQKNLNNY